MPDLKPLTDADCRALGLEPLSRERDDDMGARWVRDMREFVSGLYASAYENPRHGEVALVQRRGAFLSRDPAYGNLRNAFAQQRWDGALGRFVDDVRLPQAVLADKEDARNDLYLWYASDLPPDLLAKCFNAHMVPAWEAATDWKQGLEAKPGVAAPPLPEQSRENRTPDEGRPQAVIDDELYGTKDNLLETAWAIIANVSAGDWSQQPEEWRTYAGRWRDKWLAAAPAAPVVKAGDRVLIENYNIPGKAAVAVLGLDGVTWYAQLEIGNAYGPAGRVLAVIEPAVVVEVLPNA